MTTITRRNLVLGSAGAAALGLSGTLEFLPSALAASAREKGFVTYKVGDIEVISVYDGIWKKKHDDGFIRNATVDQTRAALEKGGLSPDFVPIEFAMTLVKSGGKTILIDAGTGAQLAPTAGKAMKHLADAGVDVKTIDTVLISHFHPDHIFGLMQKGTNAQVFPDASIAVPEAEFKFWTDPSLIDKLPERRKGLAKRIQATLPNWKNVSQFGDGAEVAPGITSVSAHGHTPGHTAFHVASGDQQLLVMATFPMFRPCSSPTRIGMRCSTVTRPWPRKPACAVQACDCRQGHGRRLPLRLPNPGTIAADGNGYVFTPIGG